MPSLRDQFHSYYMPGEDAIASALRTGLVVPDTNVLLAAYRFQATARDELLSLFEKVEDRLWIPHQVGLEFHRNRLSTIANQEAYFAKTQKELDDSIESLRGKVRAFRARIALGNEDIKSIEDVIGHLRELIKSQVTSAEEANDVHLDDHGSDEVLARIDALFENRVGAPMEPAELEEARAEAAKRIKEKIPPGYMDKGKDRGDSAGDYLAWRQLLNEARERKIPVVLVTDDRKEDWYEIYEGKTLGARRELRETMTSEAGVPLLMMTTRRFLTQGGKHLNVHVSPETVDQARELLNRVHVHVSRQITWSTLATEDSQSWHEQVLGGIRTGSAVSPVVIKHAMPPLAVELGDEFLPKMVAAVSDGLETGDLTKDDGRRILTAVMQFVAAEGQPSTESPDE
jgi:hypothetical protein